MYIYAICYKYVMQISYSVHCCYSTSYNLELIINSL